MTPTPPTDLAARVRALAEDVLADRAAFVVDVEVRGQPGSRVLDVYVDTDQGIGLDELAEISHDLGFLLETEDVVKGRYHLNVSSPGANRPLRLPRQYRQHVGRPLRVVTGDAEARRERTGTLTAVSDDAFELDVEGQPETVAFAAVTEARVQLPW
jgi:ribosome maturation factor RimP